MTPQRLPRDGPLKFRNSHATPHAGPSRNSRSASSSSALTKSSTRKQPRNSGCAAGALVPGLDQNQLLYIACAITGVNLFGLGAFKARFHDRMYVRSGIETLILGSVCAAVAFYVGRLVAQFAAINELFALPPTTLQASQ